MSLFKNKELYYIIIISALSFLAMGWSAGQNHFFYADDWGQLYYAHFYKYSELFNLVPTQIYNDRPIGWIFIKIIYQIFGLNPTPFHIILLLVHTINSLLTYLIIKKIYNSAYWAFLAAVIFGTYVPALVAITWIAAAFDILVCTFLLMTLYLYLFKNLKVVFIGLFTFYLALRTKEIALFFPIILFIFELLKNYKNINKFMIREKIRKLLPFFSMMFLIGLIYLSLDFLIEKDDQYYMLVNFEQLYKGMEFYLIPFFFSYLKIGILPILYFALIIYSIIRKNPALLFALLGFPIALGPVIFLVNHRDALYLYYPLFYFSIVLVTFIKDLFELITKSQEWLMKIFKPALAIIIMIICIINVYFSYSSDYAKYQGEISQSEKIEFDFMRNNFLGTPYNTKFFISGLPKYVNIFDYLDGYSMKILFNSDSIKVYINKPEEELKTMYQNSPQPKYFLRWENGALKKINI